MRQVPDEEQPEFIRRLREQARRDTEMFRPRPGYPIYGLTAPELTPVTRTQSSWANGEWTSITLTFGSRTEGPCVSVTTAAHDQGTRSHARTKPLGSDPRPALVAAIERELGGAGYNREWAELGSGEQPVITREHLADGEALVARYGQAWAARLLDAVAAGDQVVVTVTGLGAEPESVRLKPLADLGPIFEAQVAKLERIIEKRRSEPQPPQPAPPELPRAEGVDALRVLIAFTLAAHAEIRAARDPGTQRRQHGPNWASTGGALWQRAVREQQRLTGADAEAADDAVTSVVFQLGHLAEMAPWFAADMRLRELAIDETLRYAMHGERVSSAKPQWAWTRRWAAYTAGLGLAPGTDSLVGDREPSAALYDEWLAAWAAWAENA
jgi:antitoxin (DNA-binding transcriptional repressor) of toxin-antitoxin stability system